MNWVIRLFQTLCHNILTLRKLGYRLSKIFESTHDISQTSSGPEILLLQSQFLTRWI